MTSAVLSPVRLKSPFTELIDSIARKRKLPIRYSSADDHAGSRIEIKMHFLAVNNVARRNVNTMPPRIDRARIHIHEDVIGRKGFSRLPGYGVTEELDLVFLSIPELLVAGSMNGLAIA